MKLNPKAEIISLIDRPSTDLVIAAHQDDVELMCPMGIAKCHDSPDLGLVSVIVTDGGGSPRSGKYACFTCDEMVKVRRNEQIEAAKIGKYKDLVFLNYQSQQIKTQKNQDLLTDLVSIIKHYKPSTIYVHNLLDKHLTHAVIAYFSVLAIRELDLDLRPSALYGCEVWRGLDWLCDDEKIVFDLTGRDKLLMDVLSPFQSQIAGGKRYDLACMGRRQANATFIRQNQVDICRLAAYAMDLTPLILNDNLDIKQFALDAINRFKNSVLV